MEPQGETKPCYNQMLIVEKYERLVQYLYPIAQSIPRKHGVAREMFLRQLFLVPELFYQAGKSNQVGRIYMADSGLACLRFWMRFLVQIRCLSPSQIQTAQVLLSEVGSILGGWVKHRKGQVGQ